MVFGFNGARPALLGSAATSTSTPPAFATFANFAPTAPATPSSSISTTTFPAVNLGGSSDATVPQSSGTVFGFGNREDTPYQNETPHPFYNAPLSEPTALKATKLERHDPRMLPLTETLVFQLQHYSITHDEGAHVLAEVILDEYFLGSSQNEVLNEILDVLGLVAPERDSVEGRLDGVLRATWQHVQNTATGYQEELEARLWTSHFGYFAVPPSIIAPVDPRPTVKRPTLNHTLAVDQPATPKANTPEMPFRFLDLPAEMRNICYEELLAPGDIQLEARVSEDHSRTQNGDTWIVVNSQNHVHSRCQTNILATCRQINHEAKAILYANNAVCVTAVLQQSIKPIFNKRLLPDHILSKLTSLVLVIDCTRLEIGLPKDFFEKKIHWKQLQGMTSLKSIRLCFLDCPHDATCDRRWKPVAYQNGAVLEQIVDRIPAACEVAFEAREGFEDDYVQTAIDHQMDWMSPSEPLEVTREKLEPLLTDEIKARQGCKSGTIRDCRFVDRSMGPSLTELGKGGKFVLGQ